MSTTHSLPPTQDGVLFSRDEFDGVSEPLDDQQAQRLSLMKDACESFASEVAGELASIRSILGATSVVEASTAGSPAPWDANRVPIPDPCCPPKETAHAADTWPESREELQGHDRIAALKERLAEKLGSETNRPPRERPAGDSTFALQEGEES